MVKPELENKALIVRVSFVALLLIAAGAYAVQMFVLPKFNSLKAPTWSYPPESVVYRYSFQSDGLTITFGDMSLSNPQVNTIIEQDLKAIKASGFDGLKLNFTFQSNNFLADRIALRASQAGLYTIGLLEGYRAKPRQRGFNAEEIREWQSFVRNEVSANKNTIYYWEIWNEPSLDLFRYGSPEEYVQLLKATYPIIKEINPQARVIATLSAEGRNRSDFEETVLALGGGDYFDVISFHPYGANPYLQEDQILGAITQQHALLAKYNNRWPLVISEIGQPTSEVSEAEQARLAQFVYDQAARNNLPVTWYYWSDEHLPAQYVASDGSANWGLIRYDGSQRPALAAIQATFSK